MQSSLRQLRTCTCNPTRFSAAATARRFIATSPRSHFTPSSSHREQLPWFVDPDSLPTSSTTTTSSSLSATSPKLATAPVPTQPPSHLPPFLHPLHAHLSVSPFLDKTSLSYINAREADPDNSWTDWVVLASLREGRERGLRGAIEGVRVFLAANPISSTPPPSATPFSPPAHSPLITGLPSAPSKHARARKSAPSPSRTADQASGWAMLDAGEVVVHVMTSEARTSWGIEQLWEGVGRENQRSQPSEAAALEADAADEGEYEEMTEAELKMVREREGKKVYDE